ncbi:AAA family ATPase [Bosea sp. RCC_152_1]|uniref:AAA family ATPase n=1 Tax=Bosea sp. RCC_152_1 TaxID=3239228 RepID=UPI003524FE37
MAADETLQVDAIDESDLHCDGELCLSEAACICGLHHWRAGSHGPKPQQPASIEPEGASGADVYDHAEALRQIGLLAGEDLAMPRRLSESDETRLAHLRELVENKPKRPLLHPNHGWRLNLASLREDCPPFAIVTDLIDRAVSLSIMTGAPLRLPPLLLVGAPGVGKTHYCRALAEALATSVRKIACNAASDAKQLFVGLPTAWKGARMGIVTETLLMSSSASPLILLDEVDKFRTHNSEDPYNILLSLLEPENSRALLDEYLRVPFDLSHALFIATANDVDVLPDFVIDRFLVFPIAEPRPEQSHTIARRIVAEEVKRHGGAFATPDDAVIVRLARSHPRRITRLVPLALGFAAAEGRSHLSVADIEAAGRIAASHSAKNPIGFAPAGTRTTEIVDSKAFRGL